MANKRKNTDSESGSDFDPSDTDDEYVTPTISKSQRKKPAGRQPQKKRAKREIDAVATADELSATPHPKSLHVIAKDANLRSTRTALLQWYSAVHASRNMPWRKPYDPTLRTEERAQRAYEVWISEIMLQQTQVATVIPYYNRWMEKFPTIRELASASIDDVNALWKGLGYYSRASRLLSGAQNACRDYNGRLPDNARDMQANIPGIGRYSAGAICSIAYGEAVPVLDGNVNRLLSRFLALHASPKAKQTLDILWDAASVFVHDLDASQHPGDVNQALIELGSTVCKVRDPDCENCTIGSWCAAYIQSQTDQDTGVNSVPDIEDLCSLCEPVPRPSPVTVFPMKAEKKKSREELDLVNVIEWRAGSDRRFLLVRRPEGGLLAGLDEFPTCPNISASLSSAQARSSVEDLLSTLLHPDEQSFKSPSKALDGLKISHIKAAGDVVHVFSHIKKTYRVQWVLLEGLSNPPTLASTTAGVLPIKKSAKKLNPALSEPCTAWVPLDTVASRNIGTGVMKVWKLAQLLWE
ncbi:unnamed protein product [Mycena citricolor]|uniref:Adenine DNA glycosylase n=1 Tax=Mycena citricolor TaxID=2018698 RepID=A0AAD2Q4C7_9AGAR|nr:unnamed protein product [Mycena citricolor]